MEDMDREVLTEALVKRGERELFPNFRPEMVMPSSRFAYWQGWIDAHCLQNAIDETELRVLEAEVLS